MTLYISQIRLPFIKDACYPIMVLIHNKHVAVIGFTSCLNKRRKKLHPPSETGPIVKCSILPHRQAHSRAHPLVEALGPSSFPFLFLCQSTDRFHCSSACLKTTSFTLHKSFQRCQPSPIPVQISPTPKTHALQPG